eukprot:3011397-Alexandrium_andersonii.AAC.1
MCIRDRSRARATAVLTFPANHLWIRPAGPVLLETLDGARDIDQGRGYPGHGMPAESVRRRVAEVACQALGGFRDAHFVDARARDVPLR